MRCQEIRRRLTELSARDDARVCGADIRAHLANCTACAQHVQAHAELSGALRDASVSDDTDVVSFAAVRSLVENRAAQITNANTWSTHMSRIARSFTRPAYLIPSVLAVVAVLALTLFPWQVDAPGSYHVAFAGVDKDLALRQFGVQRVLERLGITGANVEVGDCEASCNLTIRDLQDKAEVGKVVSVMLQLSDCQLLDVGCNVDVNINIPDQKVITGSPDGHVTCEFVNELSEEDLEKVKVVVSEVRLGECLESDGASGDEHVLQLMALKNCSIPCNPVENIKGWSDEAAARGDTLKLTFDVCGEPSLTELKESVARSVEEAHVHSPEQSARLSASSGPITGFQLNQNYPNPFNAGTTISFTAPDGGGPVILEVYNVRGQLVKTLADQTVSGGTHEFTWDGTGTDGNTVASGIYLYRLKAGDYVETKKMSLLK